MRPSSLMDKESHRETRVMKDQNDQPPYNKDNGAYHLSNIYDQLISIPPSTSGSKHGIKRLQRAEVNLMKCSVSMKRYPQNVSMFYYAFTVDPNNENSLAMFT